MINSLSESKLTPFEYGVIYDISAINIHKYNFPKSIRCDTINNYLIIRGDDSGLENVLVYMDGDQVAVFNTFKSFCEVISQRYKIKISLRGVQYLLRLGFIPHPYSIYNNAYSLGVGDRLKINIESRSVHYYVEYPYLIDSSLGSNIYNDHEIVDNLSTSLKGQVKEDKDIFVMQSAGKDSTVMMLALKNIGYDSKRVFCATYNSFNQQEGEYASKVAKYLGFQHSVIEQNSQNEFQSYLNYCENSYNISCDHTITAYNYVMDSCLVNNMNILDGGGNDSYMGYLLTKKEIKQSNFSMSKYISLIWGKGEGLGQSEKWTNIQRKVMGFPSEILFPVGGLSVTAIEDLTSHDQIIIDLIQDVGTYFNHLHPVDYKGYVRGRLYDSCCIGEKVRTSVAGHNSHLVQPYCDNEFIDYYFNLSNDVKFTYDLRNDKYINKKPLRRASEFNVPGNFLQYVSKDKGYFKFDPVEFVETNIEDIEKEILLSNLYFSNVNKWWKIYKDRRMNIYYSYQIYNLFCICAWLNRRPSYVDMSMNYDDDGTIVFSF
jgi:hypothetical protein